MTISDLSHSPPLDHGTSFVVPQSATRTLPSPSLSVLQLLNFPLAPESHAEKDVSATEFFSRADADDITASAIARLSVPREGELKELRQKCRTATTDGYKSIKTVHMRGPVHHLPLWVIAYWTEVAIIRKDHVEPWRIGLDVLETRRAAWVRKGFSQGHTTVDTITGHLQTVDWAAKLQGFPDLDTVSTLARYSTRLWLADVHKNQLMHLLRCRALSSSDTSVQRVIVADTWLWKSLESAYKVRDSNDYNTLRTFQKLRKAGQDMQNGEKDAIAFLVNRGNNHWVSVLVELARARDPHWRLTEEAY